MKDTEIICPRPRRKMATVSTGHTFFQDQSPPDDLEEAQKKAKHFAETHVPSGRPVVLITVSSRDDQSLPPPTFSTSRRVR